MSNLSLFPHLFMPAGPYPQMCPHESCVYLWKRLHRKFPELGAKSWTPGGGAFRLTASRIRSFNPLTSMAKLGWPCITTACAFAKAEAFQILESSIPRVGLSPLAQECGNKIEDGRRETERRSIFHRHLCSTTREE